MRSLTVVTWNIWFDQFEKSFRWSRIINICAQLSPDVICLQEVTPTFMHLLDSSTLLNDYDCSELCGVKNVINYGVLTLTKKALRAKFELVVLPTRMGRNLLVADIAHESELIRIGNVHLESLNNHPTREEQLRICAANLQSADFSILCGDFNFCSYRNFRGDQLPLENDSLSMIWPEGQDLWAVLKDTEVDKGITFDGPNNPLVTDRAESMRYDRVVFRCRNSNWSPLDVCLVGNSPLSENDEQNIGDGTGSPAPSKIKRSLLGREVVEVFPSDHYGILGKFQRK